MQVNLRLFFFSTLALLLFSLSVNAFEIDPKQVGSAVIDAKINWDVDMAGQSYSSAAFSTFAFFTTSKQTVQFTSSHQYETKADDFGNGVLKFSLRTAEPSQRVILHVVINSNAEAARERVAENVGRFTTESELVKITPAIGQKAAEVVGAESNPLRKASLLTSWVHNAVEYDLAYQDRVLTSAEVFEVRKGVCNEYSHLLIAMLRSQGIPARFAAGYVYSGEIWAPHAWVEVAIGDEWYPFDPTYNEGIVLDATHLKFAHGIDQNNIKEQFSARGIGFDVSKVSITRSEEISFISTANFTAAPALTVEVPGATLSANEIFNISITIANNGTVALAYPIALNIPSDLKLLSQQSYLIYLLPGESQQVNFTLLTPPTLQENYLYTYPILLRSLGASTQFSIQATKIGEAQSAQAALRVNDIRLNSAESKLVVNLQNTGNVDFENSLAVVQLDGGTAQHGFSLPAGEFTTLEFPLSLNLSEGQRLNGLLTINATSGALTQRFVVEQPRASEPANPAFSIETTRSTGNGSQEVQPPFTVVVALVAIVLIVLVTIISKLRS